LRQLSQRERVSLFTALLAAFAVLLNRYSGQEDIIIGTLAPAGRKRAEFQKLLGYFLNPVPLRLDLSGDPSFRVLLRRAQKTTLGAIAHDDVPLEHLAKKFITTPDPSRHPFFQNVISLAPSLVELPAGWSMTPMDVESGGARWDLYLELSDRPEGALGRAQYNPDIFKKSAIADLLEDFRFVLDRVTETPDLKLSEVMTAAVQQ
jgi:surfactin family lipopeptide synthetase A